MPYQAFISQQTYCFKPISKARDRISSDWKLHRASHPSLYKEVTFSRNLAAGAHRIVGVYSIADPGMSTYDPALNIDSSGHLAPAENRTRSNLTVFIGGLS